MKRAEYAIWLAIAAAAGTALGMISDRKHPAKGSLLGATAGIVAGSVAAGVFDYISLEKVPYYTAKSSLYEDSELL